MSEELFLYPSRENVKSYLSKLTDYEIESLLFEIRPNILTDRIVRSQPGYCDFAHSTGNDTQFEFDLILISHGPNKIQCIKILREEKIADSLKEAKDMSESCPVKILTGASYERVYNLKDKFTAIGAIVEIH